MKKQADLVFEPTDVKSDLVSFLTDSDKLFLFFFFLTVVPFASLVFRVIHVLHNNKLLLHLRDILWRHHVGFLYPNRLMSADHTILVSELLLIPFQFSINLVFLLNHSLNIFEFYD